MFSSSFANTPVVESFLIDWVDFLLEKIFKAAHFIWSQLSQIMDMDKTGFAAALGNLLQKTVEQPVILIGIVALIIGIPYFLLRSRKVKLEREKRIHDLEESIINGDNDVYMDDLEPHILFLDDDDHKNEDQNAEEIEDNKFLLEEFSLLDSKLAEGRIQPKSEPKTTPAKEEKSVFELQEVENEENNILKKIEKEFHELENEIQGMDALFEEEPRAKSNKTHTSQIEPIAEENDPEPSLPEILRENAPNEEESTAVSIEPSIEAKPPLENKDLDVSINNLQAEMEQTILRLSEQITEEDEELPSNTLPSEPVPAEDLPSEGNAKDLPESPQAAKPGPFLANAPKLESVDIDKTTVEKSQESILPETESRPLISPERKDPIPLQSERASELAYTEETSPEQPAAPAFHEQLPPVKPATESRKNLAPKIISRLIKFQKSLEQFYALGSGKWSAKKIKLEEKRPPKDYALEIARRNYVKTRSIKEENSLELLESFILMADQKKN
ncbi:MAG: hypothetical protein ACE5GQ_00295 [Nitrospinales bacterium]